MRNVIVDRDHVVEMEVNAIMKKAMKRWVATMLSFALILGGVPFFANEKVDTVEAAETEETIVDYGTYVWETLTYSGVQKAPVCATEGYFFAGYYQADKTTPVIELVKGTSYQAKFVPASVLSVKCQVEKTVDKTGQTPADVRLITTVDSLNYATVGFRLKTETKDAEFPLTGVLRKITADNGAGSFGYSPTIFDVAAKYYATATFTGIKDHDKAFFVEPYWITLDGTKVTGISRYMRISDSYAPNVLSSAGNGPDVGYVNIPVYLNNDDTVKIGAGTTITIDKKKHSVYTGNEETDGLNQFLYGGFDAGTIYAKEDITVTQNGSQITVTINPGVEEKTAQGLLVNLRLQGRFSYTNSSIQSRYLFRMSASNSDIKVCDILHRNLAACGTADKSSYMKDSLVVIATLAEFNGMRAYLSENSTLSGKTILLATDFEFNSNWTASSGTATTTYAPPEHFGLAATFDGQGHTIRGLCITSDGAHGGFLKEVQAAGTVKNLILDNCRVVRASGKKAGVLAGVVYGTVENVEIKNSVISNPGGATVGALCSDLQGLAKDVTVTNCNVTGVGGYTGGITGAIDNQGKIQDVLIQGSTVTDNTGYASGITPYTNHTTPSINGAVVKNCTISGNWAAGVMCDPKFSITNVQVIDGTTITGKSGGAGGVVRSTSYGVQNAKVQDVTITSSGRAGGIVALISEGASISKAYCDATITSTGSEIGGIVGRVAKSTKADSVTISDSWYAGVITGSKDVGGIVGSLKDLSATISHCHNTGKVVSTATSGDPNMGGIVGFIDSETSSTHTGTVTIEDSLNFSKFENKGGASQNNTAGIVGQLYSTSSTYVVNVNKTYSINQFGASYSERVSSGWPRTVRATPKLTLDGTVEISGQHYYNIEDEWTMALGATTNNCPTSNGKLLLTIDTSFGTKNENCWWILKDGVARLKTFKDMEFKRY